MGYIAIGTITGTHGVKGNLKVKTDSDFREMRYEKGNTLYILFQGKQVPVTVESYFTKGKVDVVKFEQLNNVEVAEMYRGCELQVDEDDRQSLEDDEYYFSDLVGLEVHSDTFIGVVKEVRSFPQGEMLIVEREGKKDALIPFIDEFIVSVDETKIIIREMEGLL